MVYSAWLGLALASYAAALPNIQRRDVSSTAAPTTSTVVSSLSSSPSTSFTSSATPPPSSATSSVSSTSSSTSSVVDSRSSGWIFDPSYDGSAKYYWDIEQVEPQSKDTWTQRQVGNWLYEYSVRQGLADSTNYLADLMNTYAFDAPDLDCTMYVPGSQGIHGVC